MQLILPTITHVTNFNQTLKSRKNTEHEDHNNHI